MLSDTERDLRDYTLGKATNVMRDVAQAFEIADLPKTQSLACCGSVFLHVATMIAAKRNVPKEVFLKWASEMYDDAVAEMAQDNQQMKGTEP
jgi:hypothetical protein